MPTNTVAAATRKNRLLNRNVASREASESMLTSLLSLPLRAINAPNENASTMPMNRRMYTPREGSLAKECTDEITPERTRNVPSSDSAKVTMIRNTFHTLKLRRASCTIIECRKAVAVSHGMNEAFSTGSHAQ